MTLLVAGSERVDAGKTTFSVGLLERTGAVGYKPRAGNDYWHDHDDWERASADGRLYGKDAKRLVGASPGDADPEDVNPIHRLWHPSPGSGAGILGSEDREFLVDRVGDQFVVNETVSLPDDVRNRLPLVNAHTVSSLDEFNEAMARLHVPALHSLASEIEAAQRAVVESYGDVARPLADLAPDAVAVVEPTRARIYDGDRYAKACEVATGGPGTGQLEERVGSVVDLVESAATVQLPALAADQRSDSEAVADAYEPAYDALLGTAFDGE
ncbi:ATPase [Halobacteria archaeon HArc-gm2]|nr:ATPase [Halobacteria archaeon HArc-gm2]